MGLIEDAFTPGDFDHFLDDNHQDTAKLKLSFK